LLKILEQKEAYIHKTNLWEQLTLSIVQGKYEWVIIAFADTLFRADFHLDTNADGVIWVKKLMIHLLLGCETG
jgi:hypothetical protein